MSILSRDFYEQEVTTVARALLGKRLVRLLDGRRLSGIIIETEAYRGEEDLACHAKSGRTKRTEVMYGPAGHAYVYFTYGMHWLLNAVTGAEGFPAAVLIRAIRPLEGLDAMQEIRGRFRREQWCNGPAKLAQALRVDGNLNGVSLCSENSGLWIEDGINIDDMFVTIGPRVGMGTVPEPWFSQPWRYLAALPDEMKNG
jgi:DNA-3-methyladenine glycosylase